MKQKLQLSSNETSFYGLSKTADPQVCHNHLRKVTDNIIIFFLHFQVPVNCLPTPDIDYGPSLC